MNTLDTEPDEGSLEAKARRYITVAGPEDMRGNYITQLLVDFTLRHGLLEWVPIGDRLPNSPNEYDVTFAPTYAPPFVKTIHFYDDKFHHTFDFEPVAWRERPIPYQKEKNND